MNRNSPVARGAGKVWLASRAPMMASALAGELCSFARLQARIGG